MPKPYNKCSVVKIRERTKDTPDNVVGPDAFTDEAVEKPGGGWFTKPDTSVPFGTVGEVLETRTVGRHSIYYRLLCGDTIYWVWGMNLEIIE